MAERLRVLKMKMLNGMNDRQRKVFTCVAHPTDEFAVFMRNEGAEEAGNEVIAKYLGLTKNAVDWSLHQIKRRFTELAELEFGELIEGAIKTAKWPMIFVSNLEGDHEFVRDVIRDHGLDTRPISARDIHMAPPYAAARSIERYSWGTVVELKLGERAATVITFGRFNEITGEVLVEGGYWKQLSDVVRWYQELNRALKR